MNRAARIAAALFSLACAFVVVAARPAAAATLDPFRPAPTSGSAAARSQSPLLPFKTAQAPSLPGPDSDPDPTPASDPAPAPAPPP